MDETIADVLLTDGTNVQSAAREGRMVLVVSEACAQGCCAPTIGAGGKSRETRLME